MIENGSGKSDGRRLGGGAIASLVGVGFLVTFMFQNTEDVRLDFLVWHFTWPLWLVTMASAVLGALVWFGVGPTPKILVAFLISFFPIVIDAAVGLRSMSVEMADLARSMGATRLQVFTRFRLPTSLPYLFSGLKVAATLAIAGTVVGEFVGADKGLGYLLLVTNSNMQTALMFATIVALTIIGLVSYYLVEMLEGLLIPWHVTHRVREESGTM